MPKELGQLTNLTNFDVSDNVQYEKKEDGTDDYDRPIPGTGFTGELYAPLYVHRAFVDSHLGAQAKSPLLFCAGSLSKTEPLSLRETRG